MVWVFIIWFVFLMTLIWLVTRWSAKRRKKREGQEMPALCTNMTAEEYRLKRRQVFSQYPELDRFVTIKRNLFIVLTIYSVVIRFINLVVVSGQNQNPLYFLIFVVGCIIQIGILGVVTGSNWRLAIVVYLWAFYNIAVVANGLYQNGISFTAYLSSIVESFQSMPMEVVAACLSLVYMLLVLLLAIWLTLVPKNRRLAEQQTRLALAIHRGEPLS